MPKSMPCGVICTLCFLWLISNPSLSHNQSHYQSHLDAHETITEHNPGYEEDKGTTAAEES